MRRLIVVIVVLMSLGLTGSVLSGASAVQNDECQQFLFSTEEDFYSEAGEMYDGTPYVSDGDVLSIYGVVCRRNAELLEQFDVTVDLGLDALDLVAPDEEIYAFSTELDSPHGNFSAGDLLFSTGFAIPNRVFVQQFDFDYDIGLDAVHFTGEPDAIREFVEEVSGIPYEEWEPDLLIDLLNGFDIDILFSIEGTGPYVGRGGFPLVLDGDVLSARNGIVVKHVDLLTPDVPAGIPSRGIDFGLDALASHVEIDPEDPREIYFSTETLYEGERSFTDGDVLLRLSGVTSPYRDLIAQFGIEDGFVGLDALWLARKSDEWANPPEIQYLCGFGKQASNFGLDGLYARATDGTILPSPCGDVVPIDGFVPLTGVSRFRVAYRDAGTPRPAVGVAPGIQHDWWVSKYNGTNCVADGTIGTDANGWMSASAYHDARIGTGLFAGCPSPNVRLAAWDTRNRLAKGYNPPDPNGEYIIWLEWEAAGGSMYASVEEHHIQLDNQLPQFPSDINTALEHDADLELRLTDGSNAFGQCGNIGPGQSRLQVWTSFVDDYFWKFSFRVRGPVTVAKSAWIHAYYDTMKPIDPTTYVSDVFQNISPTGTVPAPPTLAHVRDLDLAIELGSNFISCAYVVDMYVFDRSIKYWAELRTDPDRRFLNLHDYSDRYDNYRYITFCAVVEEVAE